MNASLYAASQRTRGMYKRITAQEQVLWPTFIGLELHRTFSVNDVLDYS
jgi:hypothetical protein